VDVRLLRPSSIRSAAQHVARHALESGRNGDIVFAPFSVLDREVFEAARYETWRRPIDELGWERFWGAFEGERIVGHLELTGGLSEASAHRARLGMGVEREFRGLGWGRALLNAALTWARGESSLSWVELSVFAHNERARALYARYGFAEVGLVRDAYRVAEKSIDDVMMVLALQR
jgi:RimJ/RimL family protein N-acetyltransferase